jgi:hypothetical protein
VALDTRGQAYTYNGRSWSHGVTVEAGRPFTGVSCHGPGFCLAVDSAGDAAVFDGARWHVTRPGTAADAVSCPTAAFCRVASATGQAMAYRAGVWSSPHRIDGRTPISALSCAAVASCVAVARDGNAIYFP